MLGGVQDRNNERKSLATLSPLRPVPARPVPPGIRSPRRIRSSSSTAPGRQDRDVGRADQGRRRPRHAPGAAGALPVRAPLRSMKRKRWPRDRTAAPPSPSRGLRGRDRGLRRAHPPTSAARLRDRLDPKGHSEVRHAPARSRRASAFRRATPSRARRSVGCSVIRGVRVGVMPEVLRRNGLLVPAIRCRCSP